MGHTQDDAFHSGAKPMEHLKGGQEAVHTQAPQHSEAMTNPRSAGADNIGPVWDGQFRAPKPGNNPANKNQVH